MTEVKGYNIYLDIVTHNGSKAIQCNQCGTILCKAEENWKAHCLVSKSELVDFMGKVCNMDIAKVENQSIKLYRYYCPNCQTCLETEELEDC